MTTRHEAGSYLRHGLARSLAIVFATAMFCGFVVGTSTAEMAFPEWIEPEGWDRAAGQGQLPHVADGGEVPEWVFVADRWLLGSDEVVVAGGKLVAEGGSLLYIIAQSGSGNPRFEVSAIDLAEIESPRTLWSAELPMGEGTPIGREPWRLLLADDDLLITGPAAPADDAASTAQYGLLWQVDADSGTVEPIPSPGDAWTPVDWLGRLPNGHLTFAARAAEGEDEGGMLSVWTISGGELSRVAEIDPLKVPEGEGTGIVEPAGMTAKGEIITYHPHKRTIASHEVATGKQQWSRQLPASPSRMQVEGDRIIVTYGAGGRGPAMLDAGDGRPAGYRDSRGRARRVGAAAAEEGSETGIDLYLVPDGAGHGWALLGAHDDTPLWAALAGDGRYDLLARADHPTGLLVAAGDGLIRGYAFASDRGRQQAVATIVPPRGMDVRGIASSLSLAGDATDPVLIDRGRVYRRLEPAVTIPGEDRGRLDAIVARIADRGHFSRPGVARGLEMRVRAGSGSDRRAAFHELLEHASPRVQRAVARALLLTGDRPDGAVTVLARSLTSPDDTVEPFELALNAEALAAGGSTESQWVESASQFLSHRDPLWRIAAADAVYELLPSDDRSGIAADVIGRAAQRLADEPHAPAQLALLRLLQRHSAHAEPARPYARALMKAPATGSDVAVGAIYLLDRLGLDESDVRLLLEQWRDGTERVRNAAGAVLRGTDEAVVPHLEPWLSDSDPATALRAMQLLRQLGPAARDAGPSVAALLGDRSPRMREAALETFVAIEADAPEAVEPLRQMLDMRHSDAVRSRIVNALAYIGPAAHEAGPELMAMFEQASRRRDEPLQKRLLSAIVRLGDHPEFAEEASSFVQQIALDGHADGQGNSPAMGVRAKAIEAMGEGELDDARFEKLEAMLDAGNPTVARAAFSVLLEHGQGATASVKAMLEANQRDRRQRALSLMESAGIDGIEDAGALAPSLAQLLKDEETRVHRRALRLVRDMKQDAEPAIGQLVKIITAAEQPAADMALQVLLPLGDEAVAELIDQLEPMITGRGESRRAHALELIRSLQESAAPLVPVLTETLTEHHRHIDDVAPWIAAIVAAGGDDPAVAEALATLLSTSRDGQRLAAVQALNRLGAAAQPAVAPLVSLLEDDNREIRMHAASTLGHIGAPAAEALPRLKSLREAEDPNLRMRASHAVRLIERAKQRQSDAG